jgi:hypothetical protein
MRIWILLLITMMCYLQSDFDFDTDPDPAFQNQDTDKMLDPDFSTNSKIAMQPFLHPVVRANRREFADASADCSQW